MSESVSNWQNQITKDDSDSFFCRNDKALNYWPLLTWEDRFDRFCYRYERNHGCAEKYFSSFNMAIATIIYV